MSSRCMIHINRKRCPSYAFLSIKDLAVLEHLTRSNIARVLVQQIRISPSSLLFK